MRKKIVLAKPSLPLVLGFSIVLYCIFNALTRSFFNGNTESDFLVSYIGEASRIMSGLPPKVSHHPPLYPYLIAVIQTLCGHWLVTGLFITFVSLAGSLWLNYSFCKKAFGQYAATGVLLAFLVSPIFLSYASMASSDIYFLFLYSLCLYFTYQALKYETYLHWCYLGLALSASFLSRTNAITLLLLIAAPLFSLRGKKHILLSLLSMIVTFSIPILFWFFYSSTHGTAFMPSETYANLAMTYFSPSGDRMSADAYVLAKQNFHSLLDVVTHDPLHMLRIYIFDFFDMVLRNLFLLVSPLVTLFAFLGASQLPRYKNCDRTTIVFAFFFLFSALTQTVLTNLKTYEYRYYLFWLPVLGALAGHGIYKAGLKFPEIKSFFIKACVAIIVLSAPFVIYKSYKMIHSPFQTELKNAITAVKEKLPEDGVLIARKSHLSYYTGKDYVFIPNSRDISALRLDIERLREGRKLYLLFGYYEVATRPQFRFLINPANAPYWLTLVASGRESFPWNLYEVRPPTDYEKKHLNESNAGLQL